MANRQDNRPRVKEVAAAVQGIMANGGESMPLEPPIEVIEPAPEPAPRRAEAPADGEETFVKIDPTKNPRYAASKEIRERNKTERAAEIAETMPVVDENNRPVATPAAASPAQDDDADPDAGPSLEQAAAQANAAADDDDEPAEPAAASPAPAAPASPAGPHIDPDAEYEFIVDGRPMRVKGAQVIRTVQVGEAADARLALATQLLTGASAQQPSQPAAQPARDVAPPSQGEVDFAALANAIQFGTQQEATEALQKLRAANPTLSTSDIDARVQYQMSLSEGRNFVRSEYADLFEKPAIARLFLSEEKRLRDAGDRRSHRDLYQAIGDSIRKDFHMPKPTVTPQPSAAPATQPRTNEERRQAKAKAPVVPRMAGARLEESPAQKPRTHEERIEALRKSRHQAARPNY